MKLRDKPIEVENVFRLGKQSDILDNVNGDDKQSKSRPLHFQVKKFEDKRQILEANALLKNHSDEMKKKIFMTPDLTQKQRNKSSKLREELRYRKNVLNQTKISKGKIMSTVSTSNETQPSEDVISSQLNAVREFPGRTFANRNIMGVAGSPPCFEQPFPV